MGIAVTSWFEAEVDHCPLAEVGANGGHCHLMV